MTDKNMPQERMHSIFHTFLAASVCAGLLLTGCGSQQTQESAAAASAAATASTASAALDASASSTADTSAAAMATTASAAAATTGAQYADPDWSPEALEGSTFSAEGKGLVIVLDPGHASQVPGTTEPVGPGSSEMKDADTEGTYGPASGLHEYELTMDVSQKLRAELEERGYDVKMTHHDTFNPISCTERAAVANENHADAFIRIHANGSEDTSANGAMTICITKDNPYHPELYSASARLSEIILDSYCSQTGARREYVWETDSMTGNNWSEVPATLIELGYMTNPDEDLQMNQDSYQKVMVKAIADGLDRWFAQMPEEELSMHPSLAEALKNSADSSSTSETADETADNADNDNADGSGNSDAESASGGETSEPAAATPASGTAAGTSAGNGTGVSADTGNTAE